MLLTASGFCLTQRFFIVDKAFAKLERLFQPSIRPIAILSSIRYPASKVYHFFFPSFDYTQGIHCDESKNVFTSLDSFSWHLTGQISIIRFRLEGILELPKSLEFLNLR